MELTSVLDYVIAIGGIVIIIASFAWNIYEVFFHKTADSPHTKDSVDSAMR